MKPLLLLGGGGHCRSCIDVIESTQEFKITGVIQPHFDAHKSVLGYPLVGTDEDLPTLLVNDQLALVTVGQISSSAVRIRLFDTLRNLGARLPVIIASTAYCSRHALIGSGTIVMHGAIVNAGAHIGENCIINSLALVEHDAQVGAHCHISTGARINGDVKIGVGCFIGSGAIIKEGVQIGSGAIIGAGQIVLTDVPPNTKMAAKHD